MWFEVMRETEQRVYSSRGLKLQSGYALLPFQTPGSFSALVGIHLKKEKSCLKKGPTSKYIIPQKTNSAPYPGSILRIPRPKWRTHPISHLCANFRYPFRYGVYRVFGVLYAVVFRFRYIA